MGPSSEVVGCGLTWSTAAADEAEPLIAGGGHSGTRSGGEGGSVSPHFK